MRISDWSSDVCSSDLLSPGSTVFSDGLSCFAAVSAAGCTHRPTVMAGRKPRDVPEFKWINTVIGNLKTSLAGCYHRSEEHTSELQSLMRISYAVFCLKKKKQKIIID